MSFLTLEKITRQWDGQGGVSDISFSLAQGKFLSILGPSGCGKSTLLRLISGLEQPQSGRISLDCRDVTMSPAPERNLSMVFQSYALFPHLSVAENVLFGLKVRRVPAGERMNRLTEALAMTGLSGLERRKPAELSGGQRQRVALARAIVAQKPLCLMDEPLSNLDAKLRNSVRRDIRKLSRDLDLTVVYVTHDQSEAMSLSDQVILMNQGNIEQIGAPEDLYQRPASIFAAQFIGEPPMSIIEGAALGYGDGVQIGIRPEAIGVTEGEGDIAAIVDDVEFVGGETRLGLSHPAANGLIAILPGSQKHAIGTKLNLTLPNENRLLFNAQTHKLEKEPQQGSLVGIRQNPSPENGHTADQPT